LREHTEATKEALLALHIGSGGRGNRELGCEFTRTFLEVRNFAGRRTVWKDVRVKTLYILGVIL
jgi:hypothetical protein